MVIVMMGGEDIVYRGDVLSAQKSTHGRGVALVAAVNQNPMDGLTDPKRNEDAISIPKGKHVDLYAVVHMP